MSSQLNCVAKEFEAKIRSHTKPKNLQLRLRCRTSNLAWMLSSATTPEQDSQARSYVETLEPEHGRFVVGLLLGNVNLQYFVPWRCLLMCLLMTGSGP